MTVSRFKSLSLFFAVTVVPLAEHSTFAAPALPNINTNNVIIVTNAPYNAKGDGIFTNTTAIQSAITAAAAGGNVSGLSGGTVRIPGPGTYLCGPLTFANYVNLQIDAGAKLLMLPMDKYPGGNISPTNFIQASSLHDVSITGPGTIDGQGLAWWHALETNSAISRPNMATFSTCTRILIQDVTVSNSPSPFFSIKGKAGNVTVKNVTILAPSSSASPASHNTDAIDLAETNAVIQDCFISTGDDNVAIGSGASVSTDILITNCFFGEGHGVSIGSHTSGGVSNLLVINCGFNGTDNAIRLKSQRNRGGIIQNLNYLNLGITNVDWPFLIYSYYEFGLGTLTGVNPLFASTNSGVGTANPRWQNITFSNIVVASSPNGRPPLMIWGMPEFVVSNVVFQKVSLTSSSTNSPGIYNATRIQFIDSQFNLAAAPSTMLLYNADVVFTNSSFNSGLVKLDGLSTNSTSNVLKFYNAYATLKTTNVFDNVPLTLSGSLLTVSNNFNLVSLNPLNFVLGTNNTRLAVVGNLTLGSSINITAGDGFTNGTYTLFTYTGNLDGVLPTLNAPLPAGYNYSLDTNTAKQVNLNVELPLPPAPPAPTNLLATATNSLVLLKWATVPTADSYSVKRSTSSDGNYPLVFSGITATNYSDTLVTNGTTYYYVVSAVGTGGESTNSVQVIATPQPSLTPPTINSQIIGNALQVFWPSDHIGWKLQIQTNDLGAGIGTNWVTVADSGETNQITIPLTSTNGAVFLRMIYP